MTVRAVVYAEGRGDSAGDLALPPAPCGLIDEHLGPAHYLIRRLVSALHEVPEQAVVFEAPLRLRGREARGSDLLDRQSLRPLLTWLNPDLRPHLAVVLIDSDGTKGRAQLLAAHIEGLASSSIVVIGVAVTEFESWLAADNEALRAVGVSSEVTEIEALAPGEAKAMLQSLGLDGRRALAQQTNLTRVRERSRSFAEFTRAIANIRVPGSRRP